MFVHTPRRAGRFVLAISRCALLALVVMSRPAPVAAQVDEPAVETPPPPLERADPRNLRFNFDKTPWRDVIYWLADESGLALHVRDIPPGSFTYSDTDQFTVTEAIDRINLFLLPEGFTLVRSGRLLSVLNLADPRSTRQLDVLAMLVTVDRLAELNEHEVVKCIFPLRVLSAAEAVEELTALKLMTTPAVFPRTNRIMVIDTVAKLKSVQAILDGFSSDSLSDDTVMKTIALKHVSAEDILTVARPHLGLATDESIGIDVSVSSDVRGESIFVTGVAEKVRLVEGLVASLDKPKDGVVGGAGAALKSYPVRGGNVRMVYDVLLTLLAGKNARLSMDQEAGAIVAWATPDIHEEIERTVVELAASESEFEVIPLGSADPAFVVSLLEQILDLPDPFLDDTDEAGNRLDAPKIDADPGSRRLFVRGKPHQIEQIKEIVAGLEEEGDGGGDRIDGTRLFPLRGAKAQRVLEVAAKFWREPNPIVLFPSAVPAERPNERVVAEGESSGDEAPPRPVQVAATPRVLAGDVLDQAPVIRCQLTRRGLLMQSDDQDALSRFREHLRVIAGPAGAVPSAPVVFYLKHTKAADAIRLLAEMLDGGEAARDATGNTLVNGYVPASSNSLLGTFVATRSGTLTMTSGTLTVVADSRLNRLIAHGTEEDVESIDGYLKIIDKDRSITSIETYGSARVIELMHTPAAEVAAAIRDAYVGRIAGAGGGSRANQRGGGERRGQAARERQAQERERGEDRPEEEEEDRRERSSERENRPNSGNQAPRDLEPTMTIAVHEPSNSLIVTAPDQLFEEVERLAKVIDQRNQKVIEFLAPSSPAVADALFQALSPGARPPGRTAASSDGSSRTANGPARSSPSERTGAPRGAGPTGRMQLDD